MEIISAIAIFVGAWLSWTVGYHINDWVAKIFTRKEKVVETKVIYTPATPVEVEQKLEQKALEFHASLPTCRTCGVEDARGDHAHKEHLFKQSQAISATEKTLKESLDELNSEQLQELIWLLEDANDNLTYEEDVEHLSMYADNIRYLNLNTPTPKTHRFPVYGHLDL